MQSEDFVIADARPEDASKICAVLRATLTRNMRIVSIYGDARAAGHLEGILVDGAGSRGYRVRVLRREGEVVGCTISRNMADRHLDYIALSSEYLGLGLGKRLLQDFEDAAVGSLTLDVFATNRRAIGMYRASGFDEVMRREVIVVRIPTADPKDGEARSLLRRDEIARAGREVRERGFSNLTVRAGSDAPLSLGLIGERSVRILESGMLAIDDALALVSSVFPERLYAILPQGVATRAEREFADVSIRMEKYASGAQTSS